MKKVLYPLPLLVLLRQAPAFFLSHAQLPRLPLALRAEWLKPRLLLTAAVALLAAENAQAHSASDAYLTLSVDEVNKSTLHGQWDIALRDLDFVLKLDDDGDGQLTWGEVKRHQAVIDRYSYEQLHFHDASGEPCAVKPTRQLIDGHADGAYAALFFDVLCAHPSRTIAMSYTLFFTIDPSHRGIFVMHAGADTSTAVLSPQNSRVVLALK